MGSSDIVNLSIKTDDNLSSSAMKAIRTECNMI